MQTWYLSIGNKYAEALESVGIDIETTELITITGEYATRPASFANLTTLSIKINKAFSTLASKITIILI